MKCSLCIARKSVPVITILEYALMLLTLFYSSLWSLFTSAGCNTAMRLGVPLLLVLSLLRLRNQPLPAMRWRRLCLLAAILAVYLLLTRFNGTRFILYYVLPLLLLTLYCGLVDEQEPLEGLLYKLSDIVLVLAAISLFCFFFGTCLHMLPGRQTVSYYWGEANHTCGTYFHLYYESQKIHFFGRDLVRNCGVFTEAPGFAIFLTIALATEVLLRQKLRLGRCALICLAALTTFSAKAILLAVLIWALRFVITQHSSPVARRLKTVLLPSVAALGILAAVVLIRDKMTSHSFFIRMDDLFACLRTFSAHPLYGTGYWNDASIIPYFTYESRYNNGLSMGILVLMAQGGLYMLALYVLPVIQCLRRTAGMERRGLAAFFLTYAGLLFVTNMPYSFLALFLLASSLEIRHRRRGPTKPTARSPFAGSKTAVSLQVGGTDRG